MMLAAGCRALAGREGMERVGYIVAVDAGQLGWTAEDNAIGPRRQSTARKTFVAVRSFYLRINIIRLQLR